MKSIVRAHIERLTPISGAVWQAFERILSEVRFDRHACLLQAGEVCDRAAFVVAGGFRKYVVDAAGIETTTDFAFEGAFVTDCDGYGTGQPSQLTIEALEPTRAYCYDIAALETLMAQCPELNQIGRVIVQQALAQSNRRALLLSSNRPENRYLSLLNEQPELVRRASVTQLASYLGITRESLSRIRSRVRVA